MMDTNDGNGNEEEEKRAGGDAINLTESEKSSTKKASRNSKKGNVGNGVRTGSTTEHAQSHVDLTKSSDLLCEKCEKTYGDEGDMLLSCEYCGKHTCISCLGMTKTLYKNISGRKDLPWFCSHCLGKSLESIKQTKSIEDRCNDFISRFQAKVETRLDQIAGEVKEVKSAMISMKDEIMKEVKQLDTSQSTKNAVVQTKTGGEQTPIDLVKQNTVVKENIVKETASELQSRIDRRNNIALFNVKENQSNIKEECIRLDKDTLQELCSEIGVTINREDIKQVKRIGMKGKVVKVNDQDIVVPRIMIVTCTEESKAKIMKNAHKLAGSSSEYFKKIGVKHDMTREEREREAKLRQEAKEKNEAEQSKDFVYLVKGLPWERRIVKIRKGGGREAASKRGSM